MRNEESEQIELCSYIRETYPNVIFNSDHSGIRVSIGLAIKIKKLHSENGIPDLSIDEPRGGYFGLKLELKAEGVNPFKTNGLIRNDQHLKKQFKMLARLDLKGYCAGFAVGLTQAKKIVDWYMALPITTPIIY